MLLNTCFYLDYLQISVKAVPLQCVFHSIRFKVNKGWSKALLLFLCPYVTFSFPLNPLRVRFPLFRLPFRSVSFLLQGDNNPTFRPTTIVAYYKYSIYFWQSFVRFLYEFRPVPLRVSLQSSQRKQSLVQRTHIQRFTKAYKCYLFSIQEIQFIHLSAICNHPKKLQIVTFFFILIISDLQSYHTP